VWAEEGRRRAGARRMPPFSQPGRRRPRSLHGTGGAFRSRSDPGCGRTLP
jgi:hypothetical protein